MTRQGRDDADTSPRMRETVWVALSTAATILAGLFVRMITYGLEWVVPAALPVSAAWLLAAKAVSARPRYELPPMPDGSARLMRKGRVLFVCAWQANAFAFGWAVPSLASALAARGAWVQPLILGLTNGVLLAVVLKMWAANRRSAESLQERWRQLKPFVEREGRIDADPYS